MSNLLGNIEKLVTNFQNSIIEIQKLASDFQNSIIEVQKLGADFHNNVLEIQLLLERTFKIAFFILTVVIIFFIIREYFSWHTQIKLQKQHQELIQKMTRIIALLEENIKNK